MIVVANSGPLISLAKIGKVELLRDVYETIHIPRAVWNEVTVGEQPGVQEVREASWIRTHDVSNQIAVNMHRSRIGAGEGEAIVLAIELNADLVLLDDERASRIAQSLGLTKTGTIGILLAAKKLGWLPAVTPLLDQLRTTDFRMSSRLYQAARTLAGEED